MTSTKEMKIQHYEADPVEFKPHFLKLCEKFAQNSTLFLQDTVLLLILIKILEDIVGFDLLYFVHYSRHSNAL